jgi:hypothetical protein
METAMSAQLQANFEILKKRKLNETAQRQVAQETAYLVESEIQHLRQSVAELEAILATATRNEEGGGGDGSTQSDYDEEEDYNDDELDDLPEKNPFPLLLPNVVAIPDCGTGRIGGTSCFDADSNLDSDLEGDDIDEDF